MLDQRLRVAEGDGDGAEFELVDRRGGGGLVGIELDGHHAAEVAHLLFGDLVALEALKAGVVDLLDVAALIEPLCDLHGICDVPVHANAQRLYAADNEETV